MARELRRLRRRLASVLDARTLIAVDLVAVSFAAAIAFGSTDHMMIAIWLMCLTPALLASIALAPPRALPVMAVAALVATAFAVVAVVQTAVPPFAGEPHPLWDEAHALLGKDGSAPVALALASPLQALAAPLAVAAAVIIGIMLGTHAEQARRTLAWFAWGGAAYAACAIVLFFVTPETILWRSKEGYIYNLTGTFTGRNMAASFLGMFLVLNVTDVAAAYVRLRSRYGTRFARLMFLRGEMGAAAVRVVVVAIALVLTSSRAGTALALGAAALAATLVLRRHMPRDWSQRALWFVSLAGGAILALQLTGGGSRLADFGFDDGQRVSVYKQTIDLISERPWLGSGLGTFEQAFAPYRAAESVDRVFDRAHSTVLEIAAEGGVPLAVVTAAAWLAALVALGHRAYRSGRASAAGPFAVLLLVQMHSLIDFPLQIPGVALTLAAISGLGLGRFVDKVQKIS